MAKREIKAVTASADVAAVIDRGADIDAQIKNLGFEDKGLKKKISDAAQNQMDDGVLSVRLIGTKSAAVVSGVEKLELNIGAEQFNKVREAVRIGLLDGVVERTVSLVLPPGDIERAAEALAKVGIQATVTESFKVVDASVVTSTNMSFTGSTQQAEAIQSLSKCVNRDVSFRVKYERI